MSRWRNHSTLMRSWGSYFLYFFVMGLLSVASAHMGSKLTKNVVAAAVQSNIETSSPGRPRALSRVEQNAGLLVATDLNATHSPARTAMAMVKPDIHPAELAAAIDRSEAPQLKASAATFAVAACGLPACNPVRVKGWRKTLTVNSATQSARVASLAGPRKLLHKRRIVRLAPSKAAAQVAAAIKLSPALKPTLTDYVEAVRLADTPGDIIRLSLSNRS